MYLFEKKKVNKTLGLYETDQQDVNDVHQLLLHDKVVIVNLFF